MSNIAHINVKFAKGHYAETRYICSASVNDTIKVNKGKRHE
jgi:hypothetical protein